MLPIVYHPGQHALQAEANTRRVAERLTSYVGPVAEYARLADLVVLAAQGPAQPLRFTAVSGAPLAVQQSAADGPLALDFPSALFQHIPPGAACGGLVINLRQAQRARVSGRLSEEGGRARLTSQTAFANCRKYITPSEPLAIGEHVGPNAREALALDDPRLAAAIAQAQTTFLATITPDGRPDVSHRGGQPGFLKYDPGSGHLRWTEYLGDGMFISAGNVRQMGRLALLVLALETGDALELQGQGAYANVRRERQERVDGLLQAQEPYPVQGLMEVVITHAAWLRGLCHPRRVLDQAAPITSRSAIVEQFPD